MRFPDPMDRIIAATARCEARLVTADEPLHNNFFLVKTIW